MPLGYALNWKKKKKKVKLDSSLLKDTKEELLGEQDSSPTRQFMLFTCIGHGNSTFYSDLKQNIFHKK